VDPIKLSFDQYQRYRVVTDAITAVRGDRAALKILDVGGSPGLLTYFLPKDDIYILDGAPSPAGRFVHGDGTTLPFRDKAFDIVTGVDVLEHIAPPMRRAFINELKRTAKEYLFIAAPFNTEAVAEAEGMLYDIIKAAKGEEHAFLKEHIEYGLPVQKAVTDTLSEGGWQTISVPNGALKRWLPMMALSIYVTGDRFLNALSERINVFYNTNYYADDNMEPSYRHLLAACRKGFRQGDAERLRGLGKETGQDKDLDLSLLTPLMTLFGYDELKKARETERKEFKKVIEAREKHIKSLKESIAKKDVRIERQKKTIQGSQHTIDELKKRLGALEKSLSVKALKRLGLTKKPKD